MPTKRQNSTIEFLKGIEKQLPTTTKEKFLEANKIIMEYVKEKGLVIYGGQAIDVLLSTKGKRIYDDSTIPDIDVYSSNYIRDMIEVANRLHYAGFKYIQGIPRKHPTSKAVKFEFMRINALDISYMPSELIELVGTFEHEGLKYISAEYTICSIYLTLSRNSMLNNFRWKKDCERLTKVLEEFPEEAPPKLQPKHGIFREHIPYDKTWVEIYPDCIFSLYPRKHLDELKKHMSGTETLYQPVGIEGIPAHFTLANDTNHVDIYYVGKTICYVCNQSYSSPYLRKWFRLMTKICKPILPFPIEETEFVDPPKDISLTCLGSKDAEEYHITITQPVGVYSPEKKIIDSETIEPNIQAKDVLGTALGAAQDTVL